MNTFRELVELQTPWSNIEGNPSIQSINYTSLHQFFELSVFLKPTWKETKTFYRYEFNPDAQILRFLWTDLSLFFTCLTVHIKDRTEEEEQQTIEFLVSMFQESQWYAMCKNIYPNSR